MKLALNGALTIGTLDGANVEIRDHVGADNIFIFGLTVDEVAARAKLGLDAHATVERTPALAQALQSVALGAFSPREPGRYGELVESLVGHDTFMIAEDFDGYCKAQAEVEDAWRDPARWWRMAIMNTARVGWFSSDRTIAEYAAEIWKVGIVTGDKRI